jgi:hypothetical protein
MRSHADVDADHATTSWLSNLFSPRIERLKWELSMQRRRVEPVNEFKFDPLLTLRGNLVVATLAEAAAFTRSFAKPRLPRTKATVLRWLSARPAPVTFPPGRFKLVIPAGDAITESG